MCGIIPDTVKYVTALYHLSCISRPPAFFSVDFVGVPVLCPVKLNGEALFCTVDIQCYPIQLSSPKSCLKVTFLSIPFQDPDQGMVACRMGHHLLVQGMVACRMGHHLLVRILKRDRPFCLSPAKLRQTDSVNPRSTLSRAAPR